MQELAGGAVGGHPARVALVRGLHPIEIAQRAPGLGRSLVGPELLVGERGAAVIAAAREQPGGPLERAPLDLRQRRVRAATEQRLGRRQGDGAQLVGLRAARVLGRGERRQRLAQEARRRVELAERRRRDPLVAAERPNSAVSVSQERSRTSRPTRATRSRPPKMVSDGSSAGRESREVTARS